MNVLLVATEETTRRRLEELFGSRRYDVAACASADEAGELLPGVAYRYAVVDLTVGDGAVEIVRRLRQSGSLTYILALTEVETPEALRPALEAGADDYLVKPVSLDALRLRLAIAERRLAAIKQVREMGRKVEASEQRSFDAEQALRSREQYFRALLENSSDLVTILNADGQILYQTSSSQRLLGWNAEDQFGQTFFDYLHPDDRRQFVDIFQGAVESRGAPEAVQFRYRSRDGEWRFLESLFTNLLDEPVVSGIVLNSRDISEHRRVSAELARERAFFQQLFRSSPTGIVILDTEDRVVDANDSFVDLFLFELDAIRRQGLHDFIVPEELHGEASELSKTVRQQQAVERETRRRRKDGAEIDVSIISYPILVEGRRIGAFGLYSDITERKNAERKLFHGAFHDALTDLPNRPMLLDRLEGALRRARRNPDYQFAVIFIDLDRFKEINDTLGHQAGDDLLIEVARRLKSCVRPGDTTARLAGDEFTILLEDLKHPSDATIISDRVLKLLRTPFQLGDEEVRNSGSLGIAFSSTRYENADEILRDADIAMYRAKTGGKDRYEIFDVAMQESTAERAQTETELRGAIDRNELHLVFQPVFSLATRRVALLEALVRWNHPQRGLITAEEMIPLGEETGLIIPLGRWVLEAACRRLAAWQTERPELDLVVTVNLSAKELTNEELVPRLDLLIRETGIKPTMLGLEIRHATLIKEGEPLCDLLWQLSNRGFRLWVDDVETDHALLGALHRVPFDGIKLSRELISATTTTGPSGEPQALTTGLAALGESLGARVVAKGIEAEDQLEAMAKNDIGFVQGFFLAEPLSADEAASILDEPPPWPITDQPARTRYEPSGSVLPARRGA